MVVNMSKTKLKGGAQIILLVCRNNESDLSLSHLSIS